MSASRRILVVRRQDKRRDGFKWRRGGFKWRRAEAALEKRRVAGHHGQEGGGYREQKHDRMAFYTFKKKVPPRLAVGEQRENLRGQLWRWTKRILLTIKNMQYHKQVPDSKVVHFRVSKVLGHKDKRGRRTRARETGGREHDGERRMSVGRSPFFISLMLRSV